MIDYKQHLINSTYNQLITQLVLWQYLTNKVKSETDQGYRVVKNQEKLDKIRTNIIDALPKLDGINLRNVKCYMPLVNDVKLLEKFRDTEL